MIVYRICKKEYSHDLSGKGAELSGGRWNSKGIAMLYTCQSRALCLAEVAVHLPLSSIPNDYYLTSILLPKTAVQMHDKVLHKSWKNFPYSQLTRNIGDAFIKANKFLILKVPSAVVQGDFNFLINPHHSSFYKVKISSTEPFEFDSRLFK
jgi:RES domain-containing protein